MSVSARTGNRSSCTSRLAFTLRYSKTQRYRWSTGPFSTVGARTTGTSKLWFSCWIPRERRLPRRGGNSPPIWPLTRHWSGSAGCGASLGTSTTGGGGWLQQCRWSSTGRSSSPLGFPARFLRASRSVRLRPADRKSMSEPGTCPAPTPSSVATCAHSAALPTGKLDGSGASAGGWAPGEAPCREINIRPPGCDDAMSDLSGCQVSRGRLPPSTPVMEGTCSSPAR
jgi:hypothetical protein